MARGQARWLWLISMLGCAEPRAVELPMPCVEDDDCDEGRLCVEEECVEAEPAPWDDLEGVQHFEARGPDPNWDLLFVVDDSKTMAQWQSTLAANVGAFIEVIESQGLELSYRLAVTTTSVRGPECEDDALDGALVAGSCRGRLEDFAVDGVDMSDVGCTDVCSLSASQLDARMLPTSTAEDPEPRVRPWIEHVDYEANLPDDVSRVDAARCFLPQGIAGCEREAPLDAMFRALARFEDPDDPAHGFLRDEASLFVLILTDEVDCSVSALGGDIFGPDNHVFWSDPDADAPTDAVCWNAGVSCEPVGDGEKLDCVATDWGLDGEWSEPDDAVLRPISAYVKALEYVRDHKRQTRPDAKVAVGVLSGVPQGYSSGFADLSYAPAVDPAFDAQYGIGPGCARVDGEWALPPVRLRDWAEYFGDRNLYSVCSHDYTPALSSVWDNVGGGIRPACYHHCAADTDDGPGVEPACQVWQTVKDDPPEEIEPCLFDGEWQLPAGAEVCHYLSTDAAQEGDWFDDMSDECIAEGSNVELRIFRDPDAPSPWPTRLTIACELDADPEQTCPGLGE